MEVTVEDGRQIADQAIVTDHNAVVGHDRGTGVDEDALAELKGAILGSAQLDWHRLTAQEQASACDQSGGVEHWVSPIHSHDGRSRARPTEYGRGQEAVWHITSKH
jgi:hypothetical protein